MPLMSSVLGIEQAIEALAPADFNELAACLTEKREQAVDAALWKIRALGRSTSMTHIALWASSATGNFFGSLLNRTTSNKPESKPIAMRLILLPGLDGTGQLFAPLLAVLPADVSATAVAYPAHEQRTYAELTANVASTLPTDEPFVIVAESFSGPIAIRLAAEAPPNLRGIILVATFVRRPGNAITRPILRLLSRRVFREAAPAWVVRTFLIGHDARPEMLTAFHGAAATASPEVLGDRLRQSLRVDEREALRKVSVPMLCLVPTRDHLIARTGIRGILRERPDVDFVKIDAPHLVLQCRSAQAWREIKAWLKLRGLLV